MSTKARVLIIDDNRVVRLALADVLASESAVHVTTTASLSNGAPLAAIESERPDVILVPALGASN
jgi:DNA-binding NarL/FixJ family response regulator